MTRYLVTMQVGNIGTSIDDVQQCWLRTDCEFASFPSLVEIVELGCTDCHSHIAVKVIKPT